LTRFPILQATNTHYKMLEPKEQRGVLQLVLSVNDQKVLFMDTHLSYHPDGETERLLNIKTMKELIDSNGLPTIVCGDFNSSPDSNTYLAMRKVLYDSWELVGQGKGYSFSSEAPKSRIDYIWSSKDVQPLKMWVPHSQASDHLPVMGEFRLP